MAPKHLSREMAQFWRRLTRDYDFSPEHLYILRLTCEAFDRAQGARQRIADDGMVIDGKRHPLLGVESKSTELFYRGIRDLGLMEALTDAKAT